MLIADTNVEERKDQSFWRREYAGGRGFEPRLTAPKTAVLPLDDPPSGTPGSAKYTLPALALSRRASRSRGPAHLNGSGPGPSRPHPNLPASAWPGSHAQVLS